MIRRKRNTQDCSMKRVLSPRQQKVGLYPDCEVQSEPNVIVARLTEFLQL